MSAIPDYFSKDIIISGKHADECDDMWKQNDIQNSYFRRLIDLYTVAPVIGLRTKHKAEPDNDSEKKRTIQLQQIYTRREDLKTIMIMILLLDESDGLSVEDRVNRAFREPQTEDQFNHNMALFSSYALGGIEILHDRLVKRGTDGDDIGNKYDNLKIANIIALLDDPLTDI